jgi:hypothetical protein
MCVLELCEAEEFPREVRELVHDHALGDIHRQEVLHELVLELLEVLFRLPG